MIKIGDKVKITDFYKEKYPIWSASCKDKIAEVTHVSVRTTGLENIDKEDRAMYKSLYGNVEHYPIVGMSIKFEGEQDLFLVSPLGFSKV